MLISLSVPLPDRIYYFPCQWGSTSGILSLVRSLTHIFWKIKTPSPGGDSSPKGSVIRKVVYGLNNMSYEVALQPSARTGFVIEDGSKKYLGKSLGNTKVKLHRGKVNLHYVPLAGSRHTKYLWIIYNKVMNNCITKVKLHGPRGEFRHTN